jgi:hypothetical protein
VWWLMPIIPATQKDCSLRPSWAKSYQDLILIQQTGSDGTHLWPQLRYMGSINRRIPGKTDKLYLNNNYGKKGLGS